MKRFLLTLLCLTGISISAAILGCSATSLHQQPARERVEITDFQSVAGTWAGNVRDSRQEHWLELTIRPDGTYQAFSPGRFAGVFSEEAVLTLTDGRLRSEGDGGFVMYTLYEGTNQQVLQIRAKSSQGLRYKGDLLRAK